jgi:hypothetical protein
VLYPLGNLYFLLKKRWDKFFLFFIFSTAFMLIYFYGYKSTNQLGLLQTGISIPMVAEYFFVFLGNLYPGSLFATTTIQLFTGILIFLLSLYIAYKNPKNDFFLLAMGFIMLIAFEAALTRSRVGVYQATSSRYSSYALLGLVFIYIGIIFSNKPIKTQIDTSPRILLASLVIALAIWGLGTVIYNRNLPLLRNEYVTSILSFRNGDKSGLSYPDKERAAQILITSEQLHIYNYREVIP